MKTALPIPTLKQELIKIYNSVNQEIFGIGVKSQKLEIIGDKIVVFAVHKRIPALKILDGKNRNLTIQLDRALIEENKQILREQIESIVGIPVKSVLKDYDPVTELAVTVIYLSEPIEDLD